MIEKMLDDLAAQGFLLNPAARKAIRAALAEYAFCAAIDSDIRKEAFQVAEEEDSEEHISPI